MARAASHAVIHSSALSRARMRRARSLARSLYDSSMIALLPRASPAPAARERRRETSAHSMRTKSSHAPNSNAFFICASSNARARLVTRVRTHATSSSNGSASSKGAKTAYVCVECGEDARQWYGQCPACKAWDSMKAIKIDTSVGGGGGGSKSGGGAGARAVAAIGMQNERGSGSASRRAGWLAETANAPRALRDVIGAKTGEKGGDKKARSNFTRNRVRLSLGPNPELGAEIERVLGGGVVPGGMTLVGGDPGVGKSTILLQLAGLLGGGSAAVSGTSGSAPPTVLYASGEESVEQVAGRAERMGIDPDASGVYLYSATRLENILEAVNQLKPSALVVDSIQTVFLEDATGSPGSVSQVRECATALLHAAKTTGMPVFIIGHVTKSGDIAGPRVLEHIVDVVLYLEGDADRAVRVLRGHKNRYGSTDEVGVFQMSDEGMKPVASPSALFLGERILSPDVSAAPTVTVQGSRPFMLEVQALTNERVGDSAGDSPAAPPIRTAVGLRFERMQLILAVLTKFVLGRRVQKHDIFINIVGGMKLEDPSTDVAVALAIASSFVEKALPADMAFFGEVGLGGELRPVMQAERRIAEAATMGFKRVLLPASGSTPDMGKKTGIELVRCNTLAEALEAALDVRPVRSAAVSQPNASWPNKFPKSKKPNSSFG